MSKEELLKAMEHVDCVLPELFKPNHLCEEKKP